MDKQAKKIFNDLLKIITSQDYTLKDLYKTYQESTDDLEKEEIRNLLKRSEIREIYAKIKQEYERIHATNIYNLLNNQRTYHNIISFCEETIIKYRNEIFKSLQEDFNDKLAIIRQAIFSDSKQHDKTYQLIAHFVKGANNNKELWTPQKRTNNRSFPAIDVIRYEDIYLYYIKLDAKEPDPIIISSSDLFLDFNKQTDRNEKECRFSTIDSIILSNLTGYSCEYRKKESSDTLAKRTEYFQSSTENIYQTIDNPPLTFRSIYYDQIILLTNISMSIQKNQLCIKETEGMYYTDYLLKNKKIPKDFSNRILEDVIKTHPEDYQIMKAYFEDPLDIKNIKIYTKK